MSNATSNTSLIVRPNFFVLGAAKCGTTSIHQWLDQHPDVCMSNPKEPFFFEAEYGKGLPFYMAKYFRHLRHEKIIGDSRHRNLYLPYVPRRIFNLNPDAKFLICMRNPVERAFSHWTYWYTRGREMLSFAAAIRADYGRIQNGFRFRDILEIEQYVLTLNPDGKGMYRTYIDSGYYAEQIAAYLEYFDDQQIKLMLFEEVIQNPKNAIAEILDFIEIDASFAERIQYIPQNVSAKELLRFADDATAAFLVEHFDSHNRRLEEILGVSLDHWREPFTNC